MLPLEGLLLSLFWAETGEREPFALSAQCHAHDPLPLRAAPQKWMSIRSKVCESSKLRN